MIPVVDKGMFFIEESQLINVEEIICNPQWNNKSSQRTSMALNSIKWNVHGELYNR